MSTKTPTAEKRIALGNKSSVKPNSANPRDTIDGAMKSIGATSERYHAHKSTTRKFLRDAMVEIGRNHLLISANPKLFGEFIAHEFWKKAKAHKPKSGDQADTGRFLLRYLVRDNKKASLYWKAIGPMLAEGTKPEELPAAIEVGGGFRKLADSHGAKQRPPQDPKPGSGASHDDVDDTDIDDDSDIFGEAPEVKKRPVHTPVTPPVKPEKSPPKHTTPNSIKQLLPRFMLIPLSDDLKDFLLEDKGASLNVRITIADIDSTGFRCLTLEEID